MATKAFRKPNGYRKVIKLAGIDGSSTTPSISRILNFKACRGAIMFGDSLLPSDCSLIVEDLKQISLCFQCAHGRPPTVPVVNLEALHWQVAKMQEPDDDPKGLVAWLCGQRVSLEPTSLRLNAAGGLGLFERVLDFTSLISSLQAPSMDN